MSIFYFNSNKDLILLKGLKISISLSLILLSTHLFTQNITSSQYLETATSDPRMELHSKKMDYLKNTPHTLPLAESLEFRTETDEFNINRQEYTVRMDFNTRKERNAQKEFHQSNILALSEEKSFFIKDNLEEHYSVWPSYFFCQKELSYRKEELLVLEDKFKVAGILAKTTGKYDLGDLIRIEDDMDEIKSQIFDLENKMKDIVFVVNQKIGNTTLSDLDFSDFISLEKIKNTIIDFPDNLIIDPEINALMADKNLDAAEINLEKARGQKLLDFAQIKYAGRGENTPYGREWSFGIGLNIPIKNSDYLDIQELEFSMLEKDEEISNIQLRAERRIADRKRRMVMLFEQYDLQVKQLAENEKNYSLEHYAKTGTDPLVLLQIKESQLKRKRSILNIEEDIYTSYLELVEMTGKMMETPFVNYLSEALENF